MRVSISVSAFDSKENILEIIIWVLIGMCSGFIAKEKGRDPVLWTILGALGGIFALIAISVVPEVKALGKDELK